MSTETALVQEKVSELLAWEKRKRRELVLVAVIFYALAAALIMFPICSLVAPGLSSWVMPMPFFIILTPFLLVRRRWRQADSARALARVDRALSLDERAVTAWEILTRKRTNAAELLVLKEAAAGLETLNPRSLFQRQLSWHGYFILPLFALWLALLWFDVGMPSRRGALDWALPSKAQRLGEYARDLQERASREGLRDSQQIGRELEEVAQRQLAGRRSEELFKRELTAMAKKIEAMGKPQAANAEFLGASTSHQHLQDLKAELEAARDSLNFPYGAQGASHDQPRWLERLAALPQLKRHFDSVGGRAQEFNQNDIKSFLDKLDRQVTGERDRRTLLDAQQFLEQLLEQGRGDKNEPSLQAGGQGSQDSPADVDEADARNNQAGTEPGRRGRLTQPPAEFQAGGATQLKGILGAGDSSGIILKGKPASGTSALAQDDVVAFYRRQSEAELNTEPVPERLKETIKRYFLSLGREGDRE